MPEELIDDAPTVVASILRGEYDDKLSEIRYACFDREKFVAVHAGRSLREGDIVEFIKGRPRYLIGEKATVVCSMSTWVKVRLSRPVGKFDLGIIRAPMTCLRKVS